MRLRLSARLIFIATTLLIDNEFCDSHYIQAIVLRQQSSRRIHLGLGFIADRVHYSDGGSLFPGLMPKHVSHYSLAQVSATP
ncbi:MAG: hypothetical protein ACYSWO_30530 [Planctomycetota bacterium]